MYISGECVDAEIQGGNGDDRIDCSDNHYFVVAHGGNGNDTIIGSSYDDQLYGDGGTDSLDGGSGDDAIYSRQGSGPTIVGGDGTDTLYANGPEPDITSIEILVL